MPAPPALLPLPLVLPDDAMLDVVLAEDEDALELVPEDDEDEL
jgi:hypothetical protein